MKFGFNSEEIYSSIPDNSSHLQISVDIFTCSYLFILYFKLAFNLSLISLFLCLKCMQNSQWEISSGRKKEVWENSFPCGSAGKETDFNEGDPG